MQTNFKQKFKQELNNIVTSVIKRREKKKSNKAEAYYCFSKESKKNDEFIKLFSNRYLIVLINK